MATGSLVSRRTSLRVAAAIAVLFVGGCSVVVTRTVFQGSDTRSFLADPHSYSLSYSCQISNGVMHVSGKLTNRADGARTFTLLFAVVPPGGSTPLFSNRIRVTAADQGQADFGRPLVDTRTPPGQGPTIDDEECVLVGVYE
jgi:hypothetical protein